SSYGRSIVNNIIMEQYNLSVERFEFSQTTKFALYNWFNIRDIVFYTGCQILRSEFIQRGCFLKLPEPARVFIKMNLIPSKKNFVLFSFDGNIENILSAGYSAFSPSLMMLPFPLKQRLILCFPCNIEHVTLGEAVNPMFLNLVTRYAKKYPIGSFI
ncbi:hypothetical protein J4198_005310, partial [Salmonella enterica]|nr:hypothetical protein [Salmonella enterica]EHG4041473.1 hypothetical protein [Salmonella enterica]